jgi:cobalt-zinc-cadmium efflux system protein
MAMGLLSSARDAREAHVTFLAMHAAADSAHAGHGHTHARHARHGTARWRLGLALVLTFGFLLAEIAGAWWSGSLALAADAGHMLSDVGSLALALFAAWVAARPAGRRWTYGRVRAEILAALAQGVALVGVAVGIAIEAFDRLSHPPEVGGAALFAIASLGLAINLVCLWILAEDSHHSLSVRGAWLHVLSDALGSVGAMLAGVLVWAFGIRLADPIASLAICALVLISAWRLLREVVDVLMEAAPRELDVDAVHASLCGLGGVRSVHDLHVWTVGQGRIALSCHLVVADASSTQALLSEAYAVLGARFGIDHATIQVEPEAFADETPLSICNVGCN